MDTPITRRDFLGSTLIASGAVLASERTPAEIIGSPNQDAWLGNQTDEMTGYGGVGDYARSNGNTLEVMLAGHRMRDGAFDALIANSLDTGETYDCVVVGGGISGLAAALTFVREGARTGKFWSSRTTRSSVAKPSGTNSRSMASASLRIKGRPSTSFPTLTAPLADSTSPLACARRACSTSAGAARVKRWPWAGLLTMRRV